MKRLLIALAVAAAASPALAALPIGSTAPAIKTVVALNGDDTSFDLAAALKKGPVVLYFFPAAFTQGCTLEARAFAEATEDFNKAGATVVGMTGGNVDRIKEFSKVECRDKFAVGAASADIIKNYDVASATRAGFTGRVSYVIAKNGKIAHVHNDPKWEEHVKVSLMAVQALK